MEEIKISTKAIKITTKAIKITTKVIKITTKAIKITTRVIKITIQEAIRCMMIEEEHFKIIDRELCIIRIRTSNRIQLQ
jgi:hypothetical protein